MRSNPRARPSLLRRVLLGGVLLVVGCFGTVATLAALGVIDLPFLKRLPAAPSREGLVPVPLSGQRIPMYTRVARDFLFEPKTSELQVVWLPREQVKPTMLTRPD